jgi:Ca2+-binding EF-hand superfamily protein
MTITAISPIYDFRSVARTTGANRTSRTVPEQTPGSVVQDQLDLFEPEVREKPEQVTDRKQNGRTPAGEYYSVSDLLDRFFEDKLRRHDTDGDGRLGSWEFYGSDEQFAGLDRNEDGLIEASDLKRQFLEANPEIREMTDGFAHALYDRILNVEQADVQELSVQVESFFDEFIVRNDGDQDGYLTAVEFPGSLDEFKKIASSLKHGIRQEDLVEQFMTDNPDLVELHSTLAELRNMIKPQEVQPVHIDMYI